MQKDDYQPIEPKPINDRGEQIDGSAAAGYIAPQKPRGWFATAAPAIASAATGAVAGYVLGRRTGK